MSDSTEGELKGEHTLSANSQEMCSGSDEIEKKRIWRKVDTRLLPLVSLLYLLCFL
jgi:hypothetical protein